MNPFFFGDSGDQLFGAYHSAPTHSVRGAVICYPWAREYLLAHPTLRLLAQRLAENGVHTMRFDYYGTGDSAGGPHGAARDRWVRDIRLAVDELRDLAGVRDVTLIGMRLGGALASLAAAHRPEITRLVLWDPVIDGPAYLSDLGVTAKALGSVDVLGGTLTPALRTDLAALSPALLSAHWPSTLVLETRPDERVAAIVGTVQARGADVEHAQVDDITAWQEEWGRGGKGLAVNAVNRIVAWVN